MCDQLGNKNPRDKKLKLNLHCQLSYDKLVPLFFTEVTVFRRYSVLNFGTHKLKNALISSVINGSCGPPKTMEINGC